MTNTGGAAQALWSGTGRSEVYNTIFRDNAGADFNMAESYFWNSSATGLVSLAQGNQIADPQFAGAGDFQLKSSSPCVNFGINRDWMTGALDLARNQRIQKNTVDMGAYERAGQTGSIFTIR